jgi:ferredoxin, 2Fe-2S
MIIFVFHFALDQTQSYKNMSELILQNLSGISVSVPPSHTLLKAIQAAGIDLMHACGGKGRCTTCRLVILQGQENFSSPSKAELKYRSGGLLKQNERLTCQCTLTGQAIGFVPRPTQLPHLKYGR